MKKKHTLRTVSFLMLFISLVSFTSQHFSYNDALINAYSLGHFLFSAGLFLLGISYWKRGKVEEEL